MNVFLMDKCVVKSCRDFAIKDPIRARKQLLECCQILAAIEHKLIGATTMRKADGELYRLTHQNHPCVTWGVDSLDQWSLTWELAYHLAWEFPGHACAKSFNEWLKGCCTKPNITQGLIAVRRGHEHKYVKTREEYAALMLPYLRAKWEADALKRRPALSKD